ncbi:MAG: hypothetical protein AAFY57_01390 [Cyanobacteria bacterium J06642_2]
MGYSRLVFRAISTVTLRAISASIASCIAIAVPQLAMSQTLTAQEFEFSNPAAQPETETWPQDTDLSNDSRPATAPVQPTAPVAPSFPTGVESESPLPTSYTYQGEGPGSSNVPVDVVRGLLPEGTQVLLKVHRQMIFPSYQALNTSLVVAEHVTNDAGQVLIPIGSLVWGKFEPVREESEETIGSYKRKRSHVVGSRFVADRIEVQSAAYEMSAQSNVLSLGTDPRADVGDVALKGAGYGAAGGVVLGALTGGVGFIPMLLAGGFGGAAAGVTNVDRVVTIQSDTIVQMTLADTLILQ